MHPKAGPCFAEERERERETVASPQIILGGINVSAKCLFFEDLVHFVEIVYILNVALLNILEGLTARQILKDKRERVFKTNKFVLLA